MTNASQNAMLKVLEEPNPTTIIILVTHEIDRILPTILSRLQIVNFGLVADDEMLGGFADNFSFQNDCIGLSIGRPGLAKFLNDNMEEKNFRIDALSEFEKIKNGTLNEKFKLAEQLSKDGVKTLDKLNIWMWELRKLITSIDIIESSKAYIGIEKIHKSMNILKRSNANSRLILETLFMDL
jgi:DNA polymerase-3 subunit delta'